MRAVMQGYGGWIVFLALMATLLGTSCSSVSDEQAVTADGKAKMQTVKYASRFSIMKRDDGCTLVKVLSPEGTDIGIDYAYLLVPHDRSVPEDSGTAAVVRIPLKRVTCENGFHVSLIEMLDCFDAITGVSGKRRIGQDRVHKMIDSGALPVTGYMRGLNMETLVKIDPDLAFVNVTSVSSDIFEKMMAYGLRPGFFCASLEEHPLGALEWIKFMGAFFEKDSLAASIFEKQEQAYLDVQKTAEHLTRKPSVITGYSRKGAWSIMGSSRWFVTMLEHAGSEYLFRGQETDRGHILSHEVAMDAGMKADFWVNTHFRVTDLDGLLEIDERYRLFSSVKKGMVYNNNNYRFENGRNRFWDSGMVEPHVLLADLITIFHPEVLPDHTLKYYRRLEKR